MLRKPRRTARPSRGLRGSGCSPGAVVGLDGGNDRQHRDGEQAYVEVAQQARTVRARARRRKRGARSALGRWAMNSWRTGPVAGHGLRLRKLRLRGVSRATRPNTVLARPGSTAGVAVRERLLPSRPQLLRGSARPALRRSDAAAVVCLRVGEPTGARECPGQNNAGRCEFAGGRSRRCVHAEARV